MRKILSLDPSLTCTGWCLCSEAQSPVVTKAGKIFPDKKLKSGQVIERVASVVKQVQHLVVEHLFNEVDHLVVMEATSFRKFAGRSGDGTGLARYGFLVGAVWHMCHAISGKVIAVEGDYWTGGRSKAKRRKNACRYYKHLTKIKDPGFDVSDAISLAIWWCQIGRKKYGNETVHA